MTTQRATLEDGSILAATVRSLAHDAHRVVSDPTAMDSVDVHALLRRLAWVRHYVQETRAHDLERWLDSLQCQLARARRPESAEVQV